MGLDFTLEAKTPDYASSASSSWSCFFDAEISWEPSKSVLGPIYTKILESIMRSYERIAGDTLVHYLNCPENSLDQDQTSNVRSTESGKPQTRRNIKRKRHDDNGNDEPGKGDDSDGRKRPVQSTQTRTIDQDDRLLACPFCKRDPIRYRECYKYVLKEITRLK